MAYRKVFLSSGNESTELSIILNSDNKIYIEISEFDDYCPKYICLDTKTAIELKIELSKLINDSTLNNG